MLRITNPIHQYPCHEEWKYFYVVIIKRTKTPIKGIFEFLQNMMFKKL